MGKVLFSNIIRFIGIVLFQVLILSQIELHGFISPFIYPLFILLLPFETPLWLLLLIAFFTGLTVDVFASTPGLHAAATVFMAYLRPTVTALNRPPGDYETNHRPNIRSLGLNWFFVYATTLIALHHVFYFFVEIYSFSYFFYTLIRIVGSLIFSITIILIYQYLFYGRSRI